jgi:galactokinase
MVSAVTANFGAKTLAEVIRDRGIDDVLMAIRTGKFAFSSNDLIRRVAQFHLESFELVPHVAALITSGEIGAIGDLIDQSQQFAESMLGNQVDETVFLQRSARELGALAGSAFGAGFGGSVYALIHDDVGDAFLAKWQSEYRRRFPDREPEFFLTLM